MTADDAFFRRDGHRFLPSDQARGPWNRETLHGRVVAGLLARTIEQNHHEQTFQFARLTVDLFRAPPFEPVEVATRVAREGNRIRVADGVMTSGGVEIARASAVMLRRAQQPSGEVGSPPPWNVPAPAAIPPPAADAPPAWAGAAPP